MILRTSAYPAGFNNVQHVPGEMTQQHAWQQVYTGNGAKLMPLTSPWPIFPTLETERLILREIVSTDVEDIFGIFSDPETMEYWSCRPFTSVD